MVKTAVISLSGGMDSTSLLIKLLAEGYTVYSVSFDYGQKHRAELEVLQKNIEYLAKNEFHVEHKIINVEQLGQILTSSLTSEKQSIPTGHYTSENMLSTVVPNRNAIFSSIVYGYALSIAKQSNTNVEIFLGVHSGDHTIYPDCRPEFYKELEQAFKTGNWNSEKVKFTLPFLLLNKTEILYNCLKNCEKLGLDFDTVIGNTLTSYNAEKGISTGTSGSDLERIEAFINIGRKDPIPYELGWEETVKQAKEILDLG